MTAFFIDLCIDYFELFSVVLIKQKLISSLYAASTFGISRRVATADQSSPYKLFVLMSLAFITFDPSRST